MWGGFAALSDRVRPTDVRRARPTIIARAVVPTIVAIATPVCCSPSTNRAVESVLLTGR